MRMSDWENIAAAVLEVGRFEQSPAAQMLGYFLCCNVYLSTSTYPEESAKPDSAINLGGFIGGTKCSKSNFYYSRFAPLWNTAT